MIYHLRFFHTHHLFKKSPGLNEKLTFLISEKTMRPCLFILQILPANKHTNRRKPTAVTSQQRSSSDFPPSAFPLFPESAAGCCTAVVAAGAAVQPCVSVIPNR